MRFSVLSVLLFGALIRSANAFSLLPSAGLEDARWRELPIRFKVNYTFSPYSKGELKAILSDALSLWNGVSTSTMAIEVGDETTATAEDLLSGASTENAIVFDPNFAKNTGAASPSVLAISTNTHDGDRYTQAIILINLESTGLSDPTRLRVIVAHETGHAFGLGHTNDESALMYPYAQKIDKLGEEDVQGVSYLYPRKEAVNSVPFGCASVAEVATGGFAASSRASGGPLFAGWATLFAGAWRWLRRRR